MTELVFILDRSGSMAGREKDTIGAFNSMMEKQRNLYQVRDIKLYDHIKDEISQDKEMIKFYDEELAYMEFVQHGVAFHFLYEENMFDTDGITFDVETC